MVEDREAHACNITEMDMKPSSIQSNFIEFKTVLKGGVATIPDKMTDWVGDFVRRYDRKTTSMIEGDFSNTRFYFEPEFEEEEYEKVIAEEKL